MSEKMQIALQAKGYLGLGPDGAKVEFFFFLNGKKIRQKSDFDRTIFLIEDKSCGLS